MRSFVSTNELQCRQKAGIGAVHMAARSSDNMTRLPHRDVTAPSQAQAGR